MIQAIFKHRIIVAIVVIGVIVFVGYLAFSGSSSVSGKTSGGVTKQAVTQTAASAAGIASGPGQEFVSQLLAIQNIKLNLDLFTDPVFLGLQDFSHEIAPQPVSRPNPFAPIDLNALSVSESSSDTAVLGGAGAASVPAQSETAAVGASKPAAGLKTQTAQTAQTSTSKATSTSTALPPRPPKPATGTASKPPKPAAQSAGSIFQAVP